MTDRVWSWFGFVSLSKEEAALELMQREVRFSFKPVVVEVAAPHQRDVPASDAADPNAAHGD